MADLPPLGVPDLVTVTLRIPKAVIRLISAMTHYDTTTEIPHEVSIALPRDTKTPTLEHPPIRVFRFSGPALTKGIEQHAIDGFPVRIYFPAKTVADAFRARSKLGVDVAIEALRLSIERGRATPSEVLKFARLCRVETVVRPYLEAIV